MSNLKQIENLNIVENTDISDFYTINGSLISWSLVNNRNDAGFKTNSLSHFWSLLGGYSDSIVDSYDIPYSEGGFKETSLEGIYDSYYTNGMIVGVFEPSTYRKGIFGGDSSIQLSVSGGTGGLSGLTATTLYTTFFDQPQMLQRQESGPCSLTLADTLYFETLPDAVIKTGIGQALENGNSAGRDYQSGITFLFSDALSFTTGSTTGQSFSTSNKIVNPYMNGKLLAKFTGEGYHKAVGMVDGVSGLICLWDEYIVSSFAWGSATGGTGTTMVTFPPTINYSNIKDIDTSPEAIVRVQAEPGSFKTSTNPSRDQAIQAGVECEEQIQITEVCLWDSSGQCTAMGIPSSVVTKDANGFFIVDLKVTLDGGLKLNPYLPENGGLGLYLVP